MSFWDFFWLLVWSFFFVAFLMALFQIVVDLFRDQELSGWARRCGCSSSSSCRCWVR